MSKPRPNPSGEQLRRLLWLARHPAVDVIGIDEVGYGALAGPLIVGGVVLTKGWDHELCRDSKALSARQRETALPIIRDSWLSAVVVGMEAPDVDQVGVDKALVQLTSQVGDILSTMYPEAVLVQDGDLPAPVEHRDNSNMTWMAGADTLVPAVSAASILAKVTRDADMVGYSEVFPEYGFDRHKGYGTAVHMEALDRHGPCPIHRFTYKPVRQRVVPSVSWQSPQRKTGMDVWMTYPSP